MLYKLSYKIMDQLISLLNELSNEFQILTVLYEKKKKKVLCPLVVLRTSCSHMK